MELTNDFRVDLPVDQAWAILTDVERIAPCMPGAQLQEVEGDDYRGIVKVKVGPITAQYKGQATFVTRDAEQHVAVLRAEGRETRGQGNANATITATLTPDGEGTAVSVVTDLTVTGKVAQFGRGVMADVSAKLLGQFVTCLESTVLAGDGAPAGAATAAPAEPGAQASPTANSGPDVDPAGAAPETVIASAPSAVPPGPGTTTSGPRRIDAPEAQPVDLLEAAGSPVAKRVGPVLAVLAVAWLLKKLLSRRR
jgi:hypothetical protein